MKRLPSIVVPTRLLRTGNRSIFANRRTLITGSMVLAAAAMLPVASGCSDTTKEAIFGFLKMVAEKLLVALTEEFKGSSEFANKGEEPQSVSMALTLFDDTTTDQDEGLVEAEIPATGESFTVLWGGLHAPKVGKYYTQGRALGDTKRTETVEAKA